LSFLLGNEVGISSHFQSHGFDELVQSRDNPLVEPIELGDSFGR
jgi:hypothetical protein